MSSLDTRSVWTARLAAFERQPAAAVGLRRAAVAIAIVTDADGRACFLLTRRSASLRSHPGQYALPGGSIDAGETDIAAARRELREELGLDVPESAVLGVLDDYTTRSGFVMTPVVVWAADLGTELAPEPAEVDEVFRVPVADLDVEPILITIAESDRPVIRLPLLGRFVHAPTAAVLHQFAEVVLYGRPTRVDHFEQPVFAWR